MLEAINISVPQVVLNPIDVSARLIQAGCAMALIIYRVNTYTIMIVERWHRDVMLRYIRTSAHNFIEGLKMRMFQHEDYTLIPSTHKR